MHLPEQVCQEILSNRHLLKEGRLNRSDGQLGQGCNGYGGLGREGQEDLKPELEGGSHERAGAARIL